MKFYKTSYRFMNVISALARAGFWVDRFWQQMQRHHVFSGAFAS
jgi:hypothetical protein